MNPGNTLPPAYFDDVYSKKEDPWNFETSEYEMAKYKATIDALPRLMYDHAFEIGCSIGVLSEMLASRCHQLLAVDASDLPLQKARKRLEAQAHIQIKKMAVPGDFPPDKFDLIIVSEVGYYLSKDDLYRTVELICEHLTEGGNLLLVHWTPFVPDYPLTGDEVHDFFRSVAGNGKPLEHLIEKKEDTYRLDSFVKKID